MRGAARGLCGRHDFSAFRAADCPARTTIRELRRLDIEVERLGPDAELVRLTIEATAFLKHMVRNIAGTLVEVGHGKRAEGSMRELLAAGDRTRAGPTAPPHGLCLDEVFYLPGNADPRAPESGED
jgi:tRNA pseudouridine38-40 synthase